MRARTRRLGATRRHVVAVASVVAVVSLLLSTPSSSAPGDPVPGEDELPQTAIGTGQGGVVTNSQGTVVRRSKMYITIRPDSPIWGILYANLFNSPPDNPTAFQGLCARGRPCLPDPFYQPECASADLTTQKRGLYFKSLLYPVAPLRSGGVDVGKVASTRVRLLAFGSVPAEVTLTLRTPRVSGRVQPFAVHIWHTNVGANIGCDPTFDAPPVTALVEGKVEITLSDLKVDGVAIDLGATCRTVRPADLQLWGETGLGGYFPNTGGPVGAFDGLHPGTIRPLDSPYYGPDNGRTFPASTGVTVPPFTGCGTGGEDLSRLMTTMASGPNNPVRLVQSTLVGQNDSTVDLNDLAKCNATACPLPAPALPVRPPLPEGDQ